MIYFDNSATTRICEAALRRYTEVSLSHYGNPSSRHMLGGDARSILEDSRTAILKTVGGEKRGTLIFCSSGSEANNLAVIGRAYAKERFRKSGKIITTMGEHAAVSMPVARLEGEGFRVARIPTAGGRLDMDALMRELTPDTFLVSMMAVNNETGAVYDIAAVSRLMRRLAPNAALHIDATQSYLKLRFSASDFPNAMITLSAHKVEGPKGVSALYVDHALLKNYGISPQILGGGQEGGLRSGTENLPAIAAFAAAAEEGFREIGPRNERTAALRLRLLDGIRNAPKGSPLSEVRPVLPPVSAPHILALTLPAIKSETMLNALSLRGICISSGSACSSSKRDLSPALLAFGLTEAEADCTVRVSLAHKNTEEEVDLFLEALQEEVSRLARIR